MKLFVLDLEGGRVKWRRDMRHWAEDTDFDEEVYDGVYNNQKFITGTDDILHMVETTCEVTCGQRVKK